VILGFEHSPPCSLKDNYSYEDVENYSAIKDFNRYGNNPSLSTLSLSSKECTEKNPNAR
jgi:hypothetical protein